MRKDNEELEAEWQKVGASDPGKQLSSKWMSLALVRALAAEHSQFLARHISSIAGLTVSPSLA